MESAMAMSTFEVDGIRNSAAPRFVDGVAGLVSHFCDPQPAATECEHFGLKRQVLQASVRVECRQDLLLTLYNDPLACAQSE
jgi:hypothetical protein